MTPQQWIALKVGDVVVDAKCGDARRRVLAVSRVSGKPGQGGKTRTWIKVPNLKSAGNTTLIINCDDLGGERFRLAES